MTSLNSKTLPNAVTDYVVFLSRILEIPRLNPGPGISWLRISVVLRTPFMETPGLIKKGTSFRAFTFHCHNIRCYTILFVSLINEHNKKAVRFLPTIPGSDTIGWGVVSPPQTERWS